MTFRSRCVSSVLCFGAALTVGLLLLSGQEPTAETLSTVELLDPDHPAPRLRGAEAPSASQAPATEPAPAPAVPTGARPLPRAPRGAKVHYAPGVVLSMAGDPSRRAAVLARRRAAHGITPERTRDARMPTPADLPLPTELPRGGKIPAGDMSERAPSWFRLNTPGEDQRYVPNVGTTLEDAAAITAALRPPPPAPEEELAPKPEGDIALRLVVRTPGLTGVRIVANGEDLGMAPVDFSCTLPRPGDLRVIATKEGHARVIHTRRLGEHHEGGLLEIDLDVPRDVPAHGDE